MPATTYDWDEIAALAESGRRMEGVELARQIALRERLEDVLVRVKALDAEIEEILDGELVIPRA